MAVCAFLHRKNTFNTNTIKRVYVVENASNNVASQCCAFHGKHGYSAAYSKTCTPGEPLQCLSKCSNWPEWVTTIRSRTTFLTQTWYDNVLTCWSATIRDIGMSKFLAHIDGSTLHEGRLSRGLNHHKYGLRMCTNQWCLLCYSSLPRYR